MLDMLPPDLRRMYELQSVIEDLNEVSLDEAATGLQSALSNLGRSVAKFAGEVDPAELERIYSAYEAKLITMYSSTTNLTEQELAHRRAVIDRELEKELDVLREGLEAEEGVLADHLDSLERMRSTVASALQATSVTPLDMGMTAVGEYVDQWDENARRLDAIAARGFAELEAHPDWAALLKIPENVLAAGEDALKSWASQAAADVRNLFRPDLLNVEAAADAVEAYMREQAARELSIDLVIGELVARGGMTAEDAERQVRQAYGLETEAIDVPARLIPAMTEAGETAWVSEAVELPAKLDMTTGEGDEPGWLMEPVEVPVVLFSGEEGAEGAGWSAAADKLFQGLKDGLTDSSLVAEFVSYFQQDITDNEDMLSGAGEALWNTVELGILVRLKRADYSALFVSQLGPLVGTWLLENGYVTQGAGPP